MNKNMSIIDDTDEEEDCVMYNAVVGITAGVFDLAHIGHLTMFKYAKDNCDYLKVAVQVDPSRYREGKAQPVETIYERYVRLKSCRYVDEVVPYESEDDLVNILKLEEYDIRFIGADHYGKTFTGDDIRINTFHFNPRNHTFSSTDLRERVKQGRIIEKRPAKTKTSNLDPTPIYLKETVDPLSMDRFDDWYKAMEEKEKLEDSKDKLVRPKQREIKNV